MRTLIPQLKSALKGPTTSYQVVVQFQHFIREGCPVDLMVEFCQFGRLGKLRHSVVGIRID